MYVWMYVDACLCNNYANAFVGVKEKRTTPPSYRPPLECFPRRVNGMCVCEGDIPMVGGEFKRPVGNSSPKWQMQRPIACAYFISSGEGKGRKEMRKALNSLLIIPLSTNSQSTLKMWLIYFAIMWNGLGEDFPKAKMMYIFVCGKILLKLIIQAIHK